MASLATLFTLLQQHGIITTIIGLLSLYAVLSCLSYPAYARFQRETYGRAMPSLSQTREDDGNLFEMLFAFDPLIPPSLGALLSLQRLAVLATLGTMVAYVAGVDFRIGG